jgi:hypothetical protein
VDNVIKVYVRGGHDAGGVPAVCCLCRRDGGGHTEVKSRGINGQGLTHKPGAQGHYADYIPCKDVVNQDVGGVDQVGARRRAVAFPGVAMVAFRCGLTSHHEKPPRRHDLKTSATACELVLHYSLGTHCLPPAGGQGRWLQEGLRPKDLPPLLFANASRADKGTSPARTTGSLGFPVAAWRKRDFEAGKLPRGHVHYRLARHR